MKDLFNISSNTPKEFGAISRFINFNSIPVKWEMVNSSTLSNQTKRTLIDPIISKHSGDSSLDIRNFPIAIPTDESLEIFLSNHFRLSDDIRTSEYNEMTAQLFNLIATVLMVNLQNLSE